MNEIVTLRRLLTEVERHSGHEWLYLPGNDQWSLDSPAASLLSEEVPPELENEPDAGVPEFARINQLMPVLPISVVQDIVNNLCAQRSTASVSDKYKALIYYYDNDSFAPPEQLNIVALDG